MERPRLAVPIGERDHRLGPLNAPLNLVEYGDYECPYCGAAAPIVEEVKRILGDELLFVFRHFPLSEIHPHALQAAEAAEAAGSQGRFWDMHDLLFRNQRRLDLRALVTYGQALQLGLEQFTAELAQHVHVPRVREDFLSGVRSGVNGTPTFFVNGVRHNGGYELESLLEALTPVPARRRHSPAA
jgi:protein-disulfide isomerase